MPRASAWGAESGYTRPSSASSRGLGRGPFKAKTRVRIPLGTPHFVSNRRAAHSVLVIAVDDADATVDKVKKSGGKLVGEIMDIPNVGRYARGQDTEGNVIGVIKPNMP